MLNKINKDNLLDTFYIFDIKNVHKQIKEWRKHMPKVEPFYSIVNNNDKEIVKAVMKNKLSYNV